MELPDNLEPWDRFWYSVIRALSVTQGLILKYVVKDHFWRSTDGTVRRLRDLRDDHLANIEQLLTRRKETKDDIYHWVLLELYRRGINPKTYKTQDHKVRRKARFDESKPN